MRFFRAGESPFGEESNVVGMMQFSHPQYLWLLPVLWGFTWWVMRGSLADLGRARGRWALGMRLAVLTLLVLALAGLTIVQPTKTLCTAFVVDVSDSIAPAQRTVVLDYIKTAVKSMKPGDTAALVAFGAEALLDHMPEDKPAFTKIVSTPSTTRTDISAGMQLAMASFPQESGKQIVLFSDGNENLGSALDQAALAQTNDVHISVVPLVRDTTRGEALLLRAETPPEVKIGAPFQVSVLAESLRETDSTLTLYRNDKPVDARQVHLRAGKTVIAFEQSLPDSGLYHYKATLDVPPENDTIPDNNIAYAYTHVAGQPRVLLVEGHPGEAAHLADALKAQHLSVEIGGPERIPARLAECAQYDSLLLADVPAWLMSPAQMAIIRSAVRDTGMGFAMVGGPDTFGAGAFFRTPIEEALPISMEVKNAKRYPSVAVALVIEDLEVQSIVNTSIEAAKATVDLLEPIDFVGALDCNGGWGNNGKPLETGGTWRVPMQAVTDRNAIKNQLNQMTGCGDPPSYAPFLLEAAHKLNETHSTVKHIILVGDGDATYGVSVTPALKHIRQMGITVSAIATGIDGPPAFAYMQDIARQGGGRAYQADKPEDLPGLLVRDQQSVSKPPIYEQPFHALPVDTEHPVSRGIPWDSAPPLRGYVVTTMKETPSAHALLVSPKNDPILAVWPYGLGRSLAFTSDASAHWGADWLGWEKYSPFWAQALRWVLRQQGPADFQTTIAEDQGRASVTIEAVSKDGEFRNQLDLRAHVAFVAAGGGPEGPDSTHEVVMLQQTAPGHYEGGFETRDTGTYVVTIEEHANGTTKAMQTATLVIPYSPEFQTVTPNLALLGQIAERTHGVQSPPAEDVFGKLRFGSRNLRETWPWLLLALAILFLLDVVVRRVLLAWGELFAALRQIILARLPAWRFAGAAPAPVHDPTLGSLLTVKDKGRRPDEKTPPVGALHILDDKRAARTPAPPPVSDSVKTVSSLLEKKRERQGK